MGTAVRIAMLLGKPPRPGTVMALARDTLTTAGAVVHVALPHEEPVDAEALAGCDLVVHRGLSAPAADVVGRLHARGVRTCNPWPGSRTLADRTRTVQALNGPWVPPTWVVGTWPEVLDLAGRHEVVVKTAAGPGRGAGVLRGSRTELPETFEPAGPYVVQPYLTGDGTDSKLYVVEDQVWGLRKPSPLAGGHRTGGAAFAPDTELREIAGEVGRQLDLHLYGVDVLRTPAGPMVVDVNDVPGYRGIPGAADALTAHLLRHASLG